MKEKFASRDDDEMLDDAERGELSREGFGNTEEKRNPIPPSREGDPPQQDPKTGRARDPELGEQNL